MTRLRQPLNRSTPNCEKKTMRGVRGNGEVQRAHREGGKVDEGEPSSWRRGGAGGARESQRESHTSDSLISSLREAVVLCVARGRVLLSDRGQKEEGEREEQHEIRMPASWV